MADKKKIQHSITDNTATITWIPQFLSQTHTHPAMLNQLHLSTEATITFCAIEHILVLVDPHVALEKILPTKALATLEEI